MGGWVAEIDQQTIAHVPRDVAAEPIDGFRSRPVIGSKDIAQVLRVHPLREFGRTPEVAKHDRHVAALGRPRA